MNWLLRANQSYRIKLVPYLCAHDLIFHYQHQSDGYNQLRVKQDEVTDELKKLDRGQVDASKGFTNKTNGFKANLKKILLYDVYEWQK